MSGREVLFAYRASARADAALGLASAQAGEAGDLLTVVVPFVEPPASRGCCGIQGEPWRQLLAAAVNDEASRARELLDGAPGARVVVEAGPSAEAIVEDRLRSSGAALLAVPRGGGPLSRRGLRRLQNDPAVELVVIDERVPLASA